MFTRKSICAGIQTHPKRGDSTFNNKLVRESKDAIEEMLPELNSNPDLTKNMSNDDILGYILDGEKIFSKYNFRPKSKTNGASKRFVYELIMGIGKKQTLDGGQHEIRRLPVIALMYLKYRYLHAVGNPPYSNNGKINHFKSNVESVNKRNNIHCCPECSHVFQDA